MGDRDGHLGEHGRPELPDAERGAAVPEVDEREADPHLRLLVPERRHAVERPEKVGLERGLRRPFAEHRPRAARYVDARIAGVAVTEALVARGLTRPRRRP